MDSKLIQPIDKGTVNKICSGQVVLNLATAVKELIENSFDAGATSIQIRLHEYGSELIEVVDNGSGVEEINFQALTLKHHTSKISDFADLISVGTFGFRGEALSSLCSLSKVSVITRHKTSEFGSKLQFDHSGKIIQKMKTARQVGTTVTLENIFCTLAVRHKEFLRNLKKEFGKLCNVLYAYGLQSVGKSISCTNIVSNKRTVVMDVKGESLKSNIISIFGSKQSMNLLQVKEVVPDEEILEEYGLSEGKVQESELKMFKLEGFISSCAHGSGRSSADRQFYYINSRPVDNSKIAKQVNGVFHHYNVHQYPFVVLNIKVSSENVDVNVTPDKRLIFLNQEKILLATLKATLKSLFQKIPCTLEFQNVEVTKAVPQEEEKKTSLFEKLNRFRSAAASSKSFTTDKVKNSSLVSRTPSIQSFFKESVCKSKKEEPVPCRESEHTKESSDTSGDQCVILEEPPKEEKASKQQFVVIIEGSNSSNESTSTNRKRKQSSDDLVKDTDLDLESEIETKNEIKRAKVDEGITEREKDNRKSVTCHVGIESIRQARLRYKLEKEAADKSPCNDVKFFSKIDPRKNDCAENELKKEISKDMFKQMEIIGQFNLGFIIAKLRSDLFIVDQHATDEKYNFETLQLNTSLKSQKLVVPQTLELTVDKEMLLLEHGELFRKNGFDFSYDENEKPTKRVKLLSIPISKNWVFGKDDVEELLFMLEDAPANTFCRPSRVRDMFASRACRKSVMIGTALSKQEMRRLIDHMGDIDQPWNCPHGRPTIRHLINLTMVNSPDW